VIKQTLAPRVWLRNQVVPFVGIPVHVDTLESARADLLFVPAAICTRHAATDFGNGLPHDSSPTNFSASFQRPVNLPLPTTLAHLEKALRHMHLHDHSSSVFAKLCDGSSISMHLKCGFVSIDLV